jgi:hypothetical protein
VTADRRRWPVAGNLLGHYEVVAGLGTVDAWREYRSGERTL